MTQSQPGVEKFLHEYDHLVEIKMAKLMDMLKIQKQTQEKLGSADWVFENFTRAAKVEVGETLDHLGYKWWSNKEPDIEQAKMEAVDLLHFINGALLASRYLDELNHVDAQNQIRLSVIKGAEHDLNMVFKTVASIEAERAMDVEKTRIGFSDAESHRFIQCHIVESIVSVPLLDPIENEQSVPAEHHVFLYRTGSGNTETDAALFNPDLPTPANLRLYYCQEAGKYTGDCTSWMAGQLLTQVFDAKNTKKHPSGEKNGLLRHAIESCDRMFIKHNAGEMLLDWLNLCHALGMNIDQVHRQYVGKAALNRLRWSKQYGSGYQKFWSGEEDNVHLTRLLETLGESEVNVDTVQAKLENLYLQLTQ